MSEFKLRTRHAEKKALTEKRKQEQQSNVERKRMAKEQKAEEKKKKRELASMQKQQLHKGFGVGGADGENIEEEETVKISNTTVTK